MKDLTFGDLPQPLSTCRAWRVRNNQQWWSSVLSQSERLLIKSGRLLPIEQLNPTILDGDRQQKVHINGTFIRRGTFKAIFIIKEDQQLLPANISLVYMDACRRQVCCCQSLIKLVCLSFIQTCCLPLHLDGGRKYHSSQAFNVQLCLIFNSEVDHFQPRLIFCMLTSHHAAGALFHCTFHCLFLHNRHSEWSASGITVGPSSSGFATAKHEILSYYPP